MAKIEIVPITGIGPLGPDSDLAALTAERFHLEDGDILVVASKAVSKTEGRVVSGETVTPSAFALTLSRLLGRDAVYCELVLQESAEIVRSGSGAVICRTRHGFVLANAGVDRSNAGGPDKYVLLPLDPDGSARRLQKAVLSLTGKTVGVIVSDTFGRPWRLGQTDLAIGTAGLSPFRDYRGARDRDSLALSHTCMAQADELASAAELVRGKAEGVPVVVIRGYAAGGEGKAADMVMPREKDMFR